MIVGRRARLQARWVRFFGGEPGMLLAAPARMPNAKTYLGDAVYLEVLPWGDVVLTTSNGECDTNRIVLEPSVYAALLNATMELRPGQPLRCPRCETPRVARDPDGR